MAGPTHGSKAFFSITDSGGVARDISALIDDSGLDASADTAEVSTGGSLSKKFIAGLKDATIPLGGPVDTVLDGYLWGILGMDGRTFVYRPQGTGTGLPAYTGSCILNTYSIASPVDDATRVTGEIQCSGDITRSIQ